MMTQKFKRGDLVRIADDLGPMMDHFKKGCDAIVIASYNDQYGGGNTEDYTVFIEKSGEVSWYHESQLTFIRHDLDLLQKWKKDSKSRLKQHSSMRWILDNIDTIIIHKAPVASILKLFDVFQIQTTFHSNGEFYVLVRDWEEVKPYIITICRDFVRIDNELKKQQAEAQ